MDRNTSVRILDIQDKIRSENTLICEYERAQAAFLEMLPQLTQAQQDILMDYLGVCVELHLGMLEKAIEMK